MYSDIGDDRFVARVWLQQGYLGLLEHDISRARGLVAGALSMVSGLGDHWGVAEQLYGMAAVLAAGDSWRGAAVTAGAAETAWERIGAAPHPADRISRDRWLTPLLEGAGRGGAAAFAEGRALAVDDAVAYALAEA